MARRGGGMYRYLIGLLICKLVTTSNVDFQHDTTKPDHFQPMEDVPDYEYPYSDEILPPRALPVVAEELPTTRAASQNLIASNPTANKVDRIRRHALINSIPTALKESIIRSIHSFDELQSKTHIDKVANTNRIARDVHGLTQSPASSDRSNANTDMPPQIATNISSYSSNSMRMSRESPQTVDVQYDFTLPENDSAPNACAPTELSSLQCLCDQMSPSAATSARCKIIREPVWAGLRAQPRLRKLSIRTQGVTQLRFVPSEALRMVPKVRRLSLRHNGLEDVGVGRFASLEDLRSLDLAHNQLKDLRLGAFSGLGELQSLDLAYNLLEGIHEEVFDGLWSLKTLSLRGNRLREIGPRAFVGAAVLHRLDLRSNELSTLHESSLEPLMPRMLEDASARLELEHNFLHCDCRLRWLQHLQDSKSPTLRRTLGTLRCCLETNSTTATSNLRHLLAVETEDLVDTSTEELDVMTEPTRIVRLLLIPEDQLPCPSGGSATPAAGGSTAATAATAARSSACTWSFVLHLTVFRVLWCWL